MNRRDFTKSALILPAMITSNASTTNSTEQFKYKYKKITPGCTIGIITPSSHLSPERIALAITEVESLGYKAKVSQNMDKRYGHLAGTDEQRVADIHAMYADQDVAAIWCGRGGYGATRLLEMLDYKLIKKNPKILIGYSDITALHTAIYQKTGQVTIHGPIASSKHNRLSLDPLLRIFDNQRSLSYQLNKFVLEGDTKSYQPLQILKEGTAKGKLIGGNLTVFTSMIGTSFFPKLKDKIVFLEDVGEEPYRIDRMLTQLLEGTDIRKANGIIIGQFSDCDPKAPDFSLSLLETLHDRLSNLNMPIIMGLPFGHVSNNITLPVGANAKLDTGMMSLEIEW